MTSVQEVSHDIDQEKSEMMDKLAMALTKGRKLRGSR
jgi:hypothetical protein